MNSNFKKLIQALKYILENPLPPLDTALQELDAKWNGIEFTGVSSSEREKLEEQHRQYRLVAKSLLTAVDVRKVIERLPNWEARLPDWQYALDRENDGGWRKQFDPNRKFWDGSGFNSPVSLERLAITELLAVMQQEIGSYAQTLESDPIIKARMELLDRLSVDITDAVITFDNHHFDVSPDVATLFMLIRNEFPKLVVLSKHDLRLDRMKIPSVLERLLDKDGKNGVSIRLPNDCQ